MTALSMSQAEGDAALQQLLDGLAALLPAGEATTAAFQNALPRLPFTMQQSDGETSLPITRFWPSCLAAALAAGGAQRQVAGALHDLTPLLRWRQNPNYRAAPPSHGFLENYGYAEIIGSYGLVAAEMRFGILVLGPGTCYPAHRHPAEEIYLPLDQGAWQRGEDEIAAGSWVEKAAGALIHHPPFVPHATRALERPLPALYLWRGDLKTEAKLDQAAATK